MSQLKIYSESKHGYPKYAKEGDAGMDLSANLEESIFLHPLQRAVIPTGIYVEIEEGHEGQVRPKSGNSLNKQFDVKLGTIEYTYRGEVGVIVQNLSEKTCEIKDGDFVAQLVISPVTTAIIKEVVTKEELSETVRGEDGFGSTGSSVNERANTKVEKTDEVKPEPEPIFEQAPKEEVSDLSEQDLKDPTPEEKPVSKKRATKNKVVDETN